MKASGNEQPGAITAPGVLAIAIILGIQKLHLCSSGEDGYFPEGKESSTQFISKLISNS
ncbi:MAG: hypothetical protein HC836_17315 [Richelia sp. RM2_1_2]|nr:hypothetical protein [Richelia sp. SM1_7_0]NJO27737.1 hypothetical protein [Richelia sp. SL_2_1]NJO59964.1 hypothetical protein [Richelia sp. RM2_1_2]